MKLGDSQLALKERASKRATHIATTSLAGMWSNELSSIVSKRPDFAGRQAFGDTVTLYHGKGDAKRYGGHVTATSYITNKDCIVT